MNITYDFVKRNIQCYLQMDKIRQTESVSTVENIVKPLFPQFLDRNDVDFVYLEQDDHLFEELDTVPVGRIITRMSLTVLDELNHLPLPEVEKLKNMFHINNGYAIQDCQGRWAVVRKEDLDRNLDSPVFCSCKHL